MRRHTHTVVAGQTHLRREKKRQSAQRENTPGFWVFPTGAEIVQNVTCIPLTSQAPVAPPATAAFLRSTHGLRQRTKDRRRRWAVTTSQAGSKEHGGKPVVQWATANEQRAASRCEKNTREAHGVRSCHCLGPKIAGTPIDHRNERRKRNQNKTKEAEKRGEGGHGENRKP